MPEALISIQPQHVSRILEGSKTVELRSRRLNLQPGTRLWIYSTRPSSRVEAVAEIESLHSGKPAEIWTEFSEQIGGSEASFQSYFAGRNEAFALKLTMVRRLEPAPDLTTLRKITPTFQPPQFFKRLGEEEPILGLLKHVLEYQLQGRCTPAVDLADERFRG
jgi:predicted transcriptional regulator